MKAEHRKELQTNALADRINRFFRGVKTTTQSTSTLFWVAVVLLVGAAIGGWWYFRWSSNRSRSAMWVELDSAVGEKQLAEEEQGSKLPMFHGGGNKLKKLQEAEDELNEIIEQHKGTSAALMARFQLAQLNLRSKGIDMLPENGKTADALASIKEAQKQYEALADDCKDDPVWCPKALLGKAQCVETLTLENVKNLDKATALYRELVDAHPDSAAGKEAAERLRQLNSRSGRNRVEEFYSNLAEKLFIKKNSG